MAIYYISPYTTTNGTGTWASPYSFNVNTRFMTNGDELRIVAKYLTDLLTPTVYSSTRDSVNTITITSGGGLGADFVSGDFVYFPDYDTFAYVSSVSANTLTVGIGTSSSLPIPDTSVVGITVRKVNSSVATLSSSSTSMYLLGTAASATNITVSDGWVAEGVQVTDGTAKSIVRTSSSSSLINLYTDRTNIGFTSGLVANIPNTYLLGGLGTSTCRLINYTTRQFNIAQVYSPSCNAVMLTGSTTTSVLASVSEFNITIKDFSGVATALQSVATNNSVINITNFYSQTGLVVATNMYNCTVNITNFISTLFASTGFSTTTTISGSNSIYNITNLDIYNSVTISSITGQLGSYTLNIQGSVYTNRRTNTITSITRRYAFSNSSLGLSHAQVLYTPIVNASSVTFTNNDYLDALLFSSLPAYTDNPLNLPRQYRLYTGYNTSGGEPRWYFAAANLLVTHADGSPAYEIIGLPYSSSTTTTGTANNFPKVTLDASVYRTNGPSIKVYLATYTETYWSIVGNSPATMSTKNIKIPVVAGTTYTISGYIRTDQTTFRNGDCIVELSDGFNSSNNQSMTTACINAWEQFTITYVATTTQEINLAIRMRFSAGAKSFWIDDITII